MKFPFVLSRLALMVQGFRARGGRLREFISAPPEWTVWFYRLTGGAEIDLVFETPKGRRAVEIKRTLTPTISKGFKQACADLEAASRHIVYPGTARFPLDAETEAIPLADLMADISHGR